MSIRKALVLLLVGLGLPTTAGAQMNYFPDYPLQNERVFKLGKLGMLEFAALSLPDGEGKRRFEITLRDPSKLEPGDRQKAKHVLVARLAVPAEAGEYMDYRLVGIHDLTDTRFLVVVPLVMGTPGEHRSNRMLLWLFDGARKRFELAWQSSPCAKPCTAQNVQLRYKPGERTKEIHVIPSPSGKTVKLVWDGTAIHE